MKKLLAIILTSTMVFTMAACGTTETQESASTSTETVEATEDAEEVVEEATEAKESIKVGMVTDTGGVNDGSFNQSSWAGLQLAAEELGIEVNYLESQADSDYVANIETFIDEEYDLIISVGFMLASATREAAEANPDQLFAIIDDSSCADLPNVACLMFDVSQCSYLVGYVAGLETETDNVGFVLGMASEVMHEFGYGFVAGALDANPDVTVQMANANAFGDPAQGKSLSVSMVTSGADVLFHAAGGTGLGVIEAATEAGIKAIGVDSDQSVLAPETVITSALKRVDNASYDVAQSVLEGTFEAGLITYDITTAGVDLVESDMLSADTLAAVQEVKDAMLSGDLVVSRDKAGFEAVYGEDAYTLD
ncbi:MAG: BMP family ABC transporter substrate-binding protein [Lachnospiraceae bacterium]